MKLVDIVFCSITLRFFSRCWVSVSFLVLLLPVDSIGFDDVSVELWGDRDRSLGEWASISKTWLNKK